MNGMPPGGMPPNMQNGYYPQGPPPFPPNMDPQQRQYYEQEMERQRQMYQQGPPEGYPPPYPYYPGPPMDMDDAYDGRFGPDYYDYDYESKFNGKKDMNRSLAANQGVNLTQEDFEDERNGPEDFFEDEYLNEYLDEDY
ncbi:MAG TPA: hypothetical protein VEK06_04155 [Myxococcota bacterium]|nr:hypothetical protein [Myxococcota bacterium]